MDANFKLLLTTVLATAAVLSGFSHAAETEPKYCTLPELRAHEVRSEANRLKRLHVYRLGDVHLAGLGIGDTDAEDVKKLAKKFGSATARQNYCTWYINAGNAQAEADFNWQYVTRPQDTEDAAEYLKLLGPAFHSGKNNFVSCAVDQGFIAIGCNGMKHRGPTVIGMLLAYSGCAPESANKMVNAIWGLNGVSPRVRLETMKRAAELGRKNPAQRAALQQAFGVAQASEETQP